VRAQPAAASVFPLTVAPRMIISIFGDLLSASEDQAQSIPLPTMLSDVKVLSTESRSNCFTFLPDRSMPSCPPPRRELCA
jgi:uncharacterized protein (TIGR03437 family)